MFITVGMCSTLARFGALLAPTVADLDTACDSCYFLPFLIMGGGSIIVGILAFLLPETRGHDLPATIEDAMALGRPTKKTEVEDCCQNNGL